MQTDNALFMPWVLSDLKTDKAMKFEQYGINYSGGNGIKIMYSDRHVKEEDVEEEYSERNYIVNSEKLGINAKLSFRIEKVDRIPKDNGHLQVEKIDDEGKFWHVGYKHYGIRTEGEIKVKGNEKIQLENDPKSLMLIDHGVGLFQYKTHWLWISSNFIYKTGERFAFNFGSGISKTESNKANEDYIIIDGKTILLEPVEIVYDNNTLGQEGSTWHFETKDKELMRQRKRTVQ